MAIPHPGLDAPVGPAIEGGQKARLDRERALAAQADSDIDAGLGVDWLRARAWLHDLDENEGLPLPAPSLPHP